MVPNLRTVRQCAQVATVCIVAACRQSPNLGVSPSPELLAVADGRSGAPIAVRDLEQRLSRADYVLLGEQHDNPAHHRVRAVLLRGPKPVVVFEHFAFGERPLARPSGAVADTSWLDANGFDRAGWKWPLHGSLVNAALSTGRPIWGSNLPSTTLRPVVRQGAAAAPPALATIVRTTPLDSIGRAIQDKEIIDGHCGKLPAAMVPGMRAAQEVRDAAMAATMVAAHRDGPTWLVAGNGHVRSDVAVPRLLRAMVPSARIVSVGLMEQGADGVRPAPPVGQYDYVIYTPALARREDPCAGLTMPSR
jgi:uncharacterized iron-regulated protein